MISITKASRNIAVNAMYLKITRLCINPPPLAIYPLLARLLPDFHGVPLSANPMSLLKVSVLPVEHQKQGLAAPPSERGGASTDVGTGSSLIVLVSVAS